MVAAYLLPRYSYVAANGYYLDEMIPHQVGTRFWRIKKRPIRALPRGLADLCGSLPASRPGRAAGSKPRGLPQVAARSALLRRHSQPCPQVGKPETAYLIDHVSRAALLHLIQPLRSCDKKLSSGLRNEISRRLSGLPQAAISRLGDQILRSNVSRSFYKILSTEAGGNSTRASGRLKRIVGFHIVALGASG